MSTTCNGDVLYVVWYDNGEPYEDNQQDVEAICDSFEKAEKFIKDRGYVKDHYDRELHSYEMQTYSPITVQEYWNEYEYMFIEKMRKESDGVWTYDKGQ